jgi:hypothetical protein
MIQARQDATHLGNVPVQGLPHEVGPYHSLMPLDRRMGISKIYGYPTPLYRAVSSIDGGVYCLRRVEGESLAGRRIGQSGPPTYYRMRGRWAARLWASETGYGADNQDTRSLARKHSLQWRNGDR